MPIAEQYKYLKDSARNETSQFGEDGILEAIFERIGTTNKWFLEVGAADGCFCGNTARLVPLEWQGIWIEADDKQFKQMLLKWPNADNVIKLHRHVQPIGADSLDRIIVEHSAPLDLDLMVIDVDGQEFYLLDMLKAHPRVLMIEFEHNQDGKDEMFVPEPGGTGQAGEYMITELLVAKGYTPVVKTFCNIIAVRNDLIEDLKNE